MAWRLGTLRLTMALAALLAVAVGGACSSKSAPERKLISVDAGNSTDAEAGLIGPVCYDEVVQPPPAFEVTGCLHPYDGAKYAVFEWSNRSGVAQTAPYGPTNQLSPGPMAQGQGEYFEIGAAARFIVAMADQSLSWAILDQTLTVSSDAPDCAERCERTQLAGPDSYVVDTCDNACGDGDCNGSETCRSCAADCDCSALAPLLDCVRIRDDGLLTASFGFRNASDRAGAIARGAENGFSPGEALRAQPVFFPPGETHDAFQVTYAETELTWTLGASSVTANEAAPECAVACDACAEGISCVGDQCRESCGDGWCTEADCATCPADCACTAARDICLPSGGCFGPPRCGIEAQCGTLDSYGTHLECGDCPAGETCVANVCKPLCAPDGG